MLSSEYFVFLILVLGLYLFVEYGGSLLEVSFAYGLYHSFEAVLKKLVVPFVFAALVEKNVLTMLDCPFFEL